MSPASALDAIAEKVLGEGHEVEPAVHVHVGGGQVDRVAHGRQQPQRIGGGASLQRPLAVDRFAVGIDHPSEPCVARIGRAIMAVEDRPAA